MIQAYEKKPLKNVEINEEKIHLAYKKSKFHKRIGGYIVPRKTANRQRNSYVDKSHFPIEYPYYNISTFFYAFFLQFNRFILVCLGFVFLGKEVIDFHS